MLESEFSVTNRDGDESKFQVLLSVDQHAANHHHRTARDDGADHGHRLQQGGGNHDVVASGVARLLGSLQRVLQLIDRLVLIWALRG